MKKIILIALVFTGFTTVGFAQTTPSIKKSDTTKTMAVKNHMKHGNKMNTTKMSSKGRMMSSKATMIDSGGTMMHSKGKMMRSKGNMMDSKATMMDSREKKMHAHQIMPDSARTSKRNSKMHQ